jgi:hypothetical protein
MRKISTMEHINIIFVILHSNPFFIFKVRVTLNELFVSDFIVHFASIIFTNAPFYKLLKIIYKRFVWLILSFYAELYWILWNQVVSWLCFLNSWKSVWIGKKGIRNTHYNISGTMRSKKKLSYWESVGSKICFIVISPKEQILQFVLCL